MTDRTNPGTGTIPLVDLLAGHAEVAAEVEEGFARVLSTGAFIKGPDVAAFEAEFAAFSGTAHCVGVANGTDALELALRAAEMPAGAGVVMPANTFVASAEAVVRAGAGRCSRTWTTSSCCSTRSAPRRCAATPGLCCRST